MLRSSGCQRVAAKNSPPKGKDTFGSRGKTGSVKKNCFLLKGQLVPIDHILLANRWRLFDKAKPVAVKYTVLEEAMKKHSRV